MSHLSLNPCKQVLVVGSGLMGAGIAQVVAQAGIKVISVDRTEEDLARGEQQIKKGIAKKKRTSKTKF